MDPSRRKTATESNGPFPGLSPLLSLLAVYFFYCLLSLEPAQVDKDNFERAYVITERAFFTLCFFLLADALARRGD